MRPKIFLFGDSITEESFGDSAWGSSLAHHFNRWADVLVRGYSGYNTRWALKAVEKVFPAAEIGEPPLAVTVFFGANDACHPDRYAAFQHVPVCEYKQNLRSIVSFIKDRWPETCIILITPPPIDEETRIRFPYVENPSGLPERTNEAAGAYANACIALAGELGIQVIDLWSKMQEVEDWQNKCLRDGLHLTQTGNRIVFEEVSMKLKEKDICPEKLAVDLPLFLIDIDPTDPLKAFDS